MHDKIVYSKEEQIYDLSAKRPHLVILGAGASRAACPEGDANGRRLPVMLDLIQMLELDSDLKNAGIDSKNKNFEDIYARLAVDPALKNLKSIMEKKITEYFREMRLPSYPTIYDYLVLSLRPKDGIATFNWDPFLWQALERNHAHAPLPNYFFLHGCATVGYCEKDNQQGLIGQTCSICQRPFKPTRLLYPVKNKDYISDPYIESQWESIRVGLKKAFLLTIFGYGAPKSDVAAMELMKTAWGTPENRSIEEIEMIDIKPEDDLIETWASFIYSHHYTISSNYFESILANHPRRSVEVYWQSLINARFREENPVPHLKTLEELWNWFQELIAIEREASLK